MFFNDSDSFSPKVNFLIIGTQKGGTTALDYYLRQHHQIGLAQDKEVHFFDNDSNFINPVIDYRKYETNFYFTQLRSLYGESTPKYIYYEPVMKRIFDYNPNMKMIAILRNPVDRAFSHWNMNVQRDEKQADFWYYINHEKEQLFKTLDTTYIDRGLYSIQIERIFKYFDKKQVLFIKYEEFIQNQFYHLIKIFEFLGVDPSNYKFHEKKQNVFPYKQNITMQERDFLLEIFNEDITKVETLIGWDCSDWRK